ncbi:MAG TPA: serine hydrolase domain-containing protein, partial [Candidatus Saccharimonadales bacterium]|nr:serine hydrolase domain-containing protein [Candidatus Saccharimonadales bacterium]
MKGVLATVALILFASASAQTQSAAAPESLATKVDRLFAPWDRKDTPGCSIAVIQGGRITYGRGYGMASLELSVPIATSSVFNAGSMAKQFTVMSILMLAQKGQLALDDNIRKYIPEVPDFGQPITLRHLISHTSGLRDFLEMLEMSGWRTGGDLTTEKDILNMVSRQRTLNHTPGKAFVYTNTGYVLLAIVIKRVTNQSLRDFAETNIFKPLGMNNTHFYDDHRAIIKGLVNGY